MNNQKNHRLSEDEIAKLNSLAQKVRLDLQQEIQPSREAIQAIIGLVEKSELEAMDLFRSLIIDFIFFSNLAMGDKGKRLPDIGTTMQIENFSIVRTLSHFLSRMPIDIHSADGEPFVMAISKHKKNPDDLQVTGVQELVDTFGKEMIKHIQFKY